MDDPRVQAMANKIDVEVEKFIPKLKKIKEDHANGIDVFESKAPKGFPKSHDASKMADNLMLYTGAHKNEKIKYMHAVSEAYDDWGDDGVRSLYAQYHPSQGRNVPMVGIDIETSGLSSTTGHIIEALLWRSTRMATRRSSLIPCSTFLSVRMLLVGWVLLMFTGSPLTW